MSQQTLTSLAVLTVNWDRGHDVIDSFVPLVAAYLNKDDGRPVSLMELQESIRREAGIKIPGGALQAMLGRCAKQGLVHRKTGVYYPDSTALSQVDFGRVYAEALRKHKCLLDKLRAFAQDRYELGWDEEQANEYVVNFLQENSLPILLAAVEGDPLPPFRPGSQKVRHVISAFALYLSEADPDGFQCLEIVVKGHILSGVLFYPDIGQVESRFNDLDVYCDTPFLLPALGYGDEGVSAQCSDLLELLREAGAGVKCFHHTREELVGVLEAIAASKRPGGYTMPVPYFYQTNRNFSLSDVEEMIAKIDDKLGELEIIVVDTPSFTAEPDEAVLEGLLAERIKYTHDKAREKDAQSIAAVARLRGVRVMDRFEQAKAIFVTRNHSLVAASRAFFKDIEPGRAIPVCMSDSLMTRLAWVKRPMVAPNVPRHAVIAASYAALNPRDELWRLYIQELERRKARGDISDAEYHLLRSSREARELLVDRTFGDEHAFTAGTVDEVLAHAAGIIREEAEKDAAMLREEVEAASRRETHERTRRELVEAAHQKRIDRDVARVARVTGIAVTGIISIAILVALIATVPGSRIFEIKDDVVRVVLWACFGVGALLGLYAALVKHVSAKDVGHLVSARLGNVLRERGHRRLEDIHAEAARSAGDAAEMPSDSAEDER